MVIKTEWHSLRLNESPQEWSLMIVNRFSTQSLGLGSVLLFAVVVLFFVFLRLFVCLFLVKICSGSDEPKGEYQWVGPKGVSSSFFFSYCSSSSSSCFFFFCFFFFFSFLFPFFLSFFFFFFSSSSSSSSSLLLLLSSSPWLLNVPTTCKVFGRGQSCETIIRAVTLG